MQPKRLFAISSLVVFLVGAALFAKAFADRDHRPAPQSYKVTSIMSETTGAAALEPVGLVERVVTADGRYRESRRSLNGKGGVTVANSDGVFTQQDGEPWQFLSDFKNQSVYNNFCSIKLFENHPQLVRTEKVLGYETYVLRVGDDSSGVDQSFAPEFGNTPLKVVVRQDDYRKVIEAVKIEFVDVPESQVALTGPVGFESAERRAEDYRRNGAPDRADAFERIIKREKASQKH